jgi:hypothetical protein
MIEYRIDRKLSNTATSHIKDMDNILHEITNTYAVMFEVLDQQETALSSPSINSFRADLKDLVEQSIRMSGTIADNSRKLVIISEQASKQLLAMEESFNLTIEKHSNKDRTYAV